jgi:predicted ribosome quality control (RQC) complex YloA/Tae2 family protein
VIGKLTNKIKKIFKNMLNLTEQEKEKIKEIENNLENIIEESKKEENKAETTERLELVLTDLRKVKEGLTSDINLKIFDEELQEVGKSWSEFSSTSDSRLLTLKNVLVHANLTIAFKGQDKDRRKERSLLG